MNERKTTRTKVGSLLPRAWADLCRHWAVAIVAVWLVWVGVKSLLSTAFLWGVRAVWPPVDGQTAQEWALRQGVELYLKEGVVYLCFLPFLYGLSAAFLCVVCRNRPWRDGLLAGVAGNFRRFLSTAGLHLVRLMLGGLCGILPAVFYGYAYALTPYLLCDNPTLKNGAALRESRRLMKGHKRAVLGWDLAFWALIVLLVGLESVCRERFFAGLTPEEYGTYWKVLLGLLAVITFCWNLLREALYAELYEAVRAEKGLREGRSGAVVPADGEAGPAAATCANS